MINVAFLHEDVRRHLNRVHGEYRSSITNIDIDSYLNHAKDIIQENLNAIRERNPTLFDQLRSIEIPNHKLEQVSTNSKYTTFKLPNNHYSTLSISGVGAIGTCKTDLVIHKIGTEKIDNSLTDTNWQPSFGWSETFYNEDSLGINIYHNNVMKIKEAYITYYRYIPDVAHPTGSKTAYQLADGTTLTEDKHLDIDHPNVWRKITELTSLLIRRDKEENYQINMETILFTERYLVG